MRETLFTLVALLASAAALAQPVKLRFASFEPAVAALTARGLTPWAKEVSEASGGALEIEMFPGGTLGRNPAQQVKLLQDGVADLAWVAPQLTPGRFGGYEVVELPFLVQNGREGGLALWRIHRQGLLTGFDDVKVLMIATSSPVFMHSRTPLSTLADLKGKRVRGTGALRVKVLDALGAVPTIPGGPNETADALAKGVIDVAIGEWLFARTFKLDEVVTNHLEMPLGCNTVMVLMTKARYDGLPTAARAAIDRHSGEAFVLRMVNIWAATESGIRADAAKQANHRITTPAPDEVAAWRRRTEPVIDAWRRENAQNERIYQAFTAELAKIRKGE